MQFRTLKSASVPASALGLGCSRLGSILSGASDSSARELIEFALDAGINFFDTANIYGQGDSERALGRALRGRRDRVILVSKGGKRFSPLARAIAPVKPLLRAAARNVPAIRRLIAGGRESQLSQCFDHRQLTRSLEGSLRRLGTDHLDAYLLHSPPLGTINSAAVFDHLANLKRAGKIRSFGVSCDDVDGALAALSAPGVTMIQVPVNPGTVDIIDRVLPAAMARGVDVIARESLMGGAIVRPDDGTDDRGRSATQKALRFVLALPGVSVVLCGTTRREHLRENLAAVTTLDPCDATLDRLRTRPAACAPGEPAGSLP